MSRPLTLATAVAVGVVSLSAPLLSSAAASASAVRAPSAHGPLAKKSTTHTKYAFTNSGFGTAVSGGTIPAGSDNATGYRVISCTTLAGKTKQNYVDSTNLGDGSVKAAGVRSQLFTTKGNGKYSSISRHTVAKVVLSDSSFGTLTISGIASSATATAASGGYQSTGTTSVGQVVYSPTSGTDQTIPVPNGNRTISIPGLGSLAFGLISKRHDSHGAQATAIALRITLSGTHSVVTIARSYAEIEGGVVQGIYHGYSAAVQGSLANGSSQIGRTPLTQMYCQGTHNQVLRKSTAHTTLPNVGILNGLGSSEVAGNKFHHAYNTERGSVASATLANGQIQVGSVQAIAKVTRQGKTLSRSSEGTTVGTVKVGSQSFTFDQLNGKPQSVPGVATVEANVVKKYRNGLNVVGLRITLLDGTGAVIDLGIAEAKIQRVS